MRARPRARDSLFTDIVGSTEKAAKLDDSDVDAPQDVVRDFLRCGDHVRPG